MLPCGARMLPRCRRLLMCAPLRNLSSSPPNPRPAAERPSAETVQQLANSARIQEKMWNVFVPERGIKFGDQRFWMLLGIVALLHTYNNYRDANKPADIGLPEGAQRRLPDGRLLMVDGSISAKGSEASPKELSLHKIKEVGEGEGVVNRAFRNIKDAC